MSPAVQEALQRRSAAPAQLSQVSGDARMQGEVPQPLPQSAMTASSNPPAPSQAPSQKFEPKDKDDLVIMALIEHLKSSDKMKKEELTLQQGAAQGVPQLPTF